MSFIETSKKVEILAPGGSIDSIYAAINCGADAVYVGGQMFGARAYADNPDSGQLTELIKEVHLRGKRMYLTVNTLLKEHELDKQLVPYLEPFYENGLDAVIVQDFGVWQTIRNYFPDLPLHASTQMTVVSPEFAGFLKENGASRIVPARELSLKEIKKIKSRYDIEIETFVHGALCYCYSGQCLMSSVIGGRSGNRGRCAQPCRLPYQFESDGKIINTNKNEYLLSPKDICTLKLIPDLIDAGIDSFKIEGRMKKPEYAALVSMLYRKYADMYLEKGRQGYKVDEKDLMHLMDMYNRGGFTEGYYNQHNGSYMISMEKPNHFGTKAAKISKISGDQIVLEAVNDLEGQDILELNDGRTGAKPYQWTLKDKVCKGQQFKIKNIKTLKLQPGMMCYRTRNTALVESIRKISAQPENKEKIYGYLKVYKDCPVKITVVYKDVAVETEGPVVSKAQNRALNKIDIIKQISKTGNTPYVFENIEIEMDSDAFLPLTALNQLRRDALEALADGITEKYRRQQTNTFSASQLADAATEVSAYTQTGVKHPSGLRELPQINVLIDDFQIMDTVLEKPYIHTVYVEYLSVLNTDMFKVTTYIEKAHNANKSVFLALPHMLRDNQMFDREHIADAAEMMDGALVRNIEGLVLLKHSGYKGKITADASVHAWNTCAVDFLKAQGIDTLTMSEELNYKEMQSLKNDDFEMIVFGYRPLMISAQCLLKTTGGCLRNGKRKYKEPYEVKDRTGRKMRVIPNCSGCYNLIYNSQILDLSAEMDKIVNLGLHSVRVELTMIKKDADRILDHVYTSLSGHCKALNMADFTKGHFKRGVE